MSGDALARGARSATFGPAKVSQEKWESIFGKPEPKEMQEKSEELGKVNGK